MRGPILLYLHLNRAVRTTMKTAVIHFLFSQQMKHCIDNIEIFIQNSPCQTLKCEHRCRFRTLFIALFYPEFSCQTSKHEHCRHFHTFVYCTFSIQNSPCQTSKCEHRCRFHTLFIALFHPEFSCQTSKREHRRHFHTFVYCTFLSRIQPARRQSVNIPAVSILSFISLF